MVDDRVDSSKEKIDLNSYWKEHGGEALREAIDAALRYPEFLISEISSDAPPGELNEQLKIVYEVVGATSLVEREAYVSQIAARFGLGKRVVKQGLKPWIKAASDGEGGGGVGEDGGGDGSVEIFFGEIQEDEKGFYFIRQAGAIVRISNFVISPIERLVEEDGGERISVWIDTVEGKRLGPYVMSRRSWRGRNDFIAELDRFPDLLWTGSSENVQSVRGIVSRVDVARIKAVSMIGRVRIEGQDLFVWPGGALGAGGLDQSGTVRWLGDGTPLSRGMKLFDLADGGSEGKVDAWTDDDTAALAGRVFPALLRLNEPEVMIAALGWLYSCIDAPEIRRGMGHFPLLWIWALQGAGKSTLATVILGQLVGVMGSPSSATDTNFAMIRSLAASNCQPVLFDEYKSDMMVRERQRFERFARRAYSGETETRGRADQSVVSYELLRPMIVCGEMAPTDPALLERVIVASPLKGSLTQERQDIMAQMACEPLWRLAAPWIQFALGRPLAGDMAAARELIAQYENECGLGGKIGIRVRDNLLVMLSGVIRLEAFCEHLGVALPDVMDHACFARIFATCSGTEDDDASDDGGVSVRRNTALDSFLRSLRDMTGRGGIEAGVHYCVDGGILHLHVGRSYGSYLEKQRSRGLSDQTNGIKSLQRCAREQSVLLRDGGYVIERSKIVTIGNSRLRCLSIDMGRLTDVTGVEPFPESTGGRWSGGDQDDWSGDD